MPRGKPVDLFVYGTLVPEANLYALTGRRFQRQAAVLPDHERIVPNVGYPYVLPKPGAAVQGQLLIGVDPRSLATLDQYEDEGALYSRKEVTVMAGGRRHRCETYIGNLDALRAHFGEDVAIDGRVREFIEDKIRALLAPAGADGDDIVARARGELLGGAIEELVQLHFTFPALFSHQAEKLLRPSELPSLSAVREMPEAAAYAGNYLRLAVRHIVFDIVDQRVFREFGRKVEVPEPFYRHTVSALAALAFLNRHAAPLRQMMDRLGCAELNPAWEYIDYAARGVRIADALWDHDGMASVVDWIEAHRQEGATPMGAELEFSNLGAAAVRDPGGLDRDFDGFYYFSDFDLHRRCWKLGGHVDDHRTRHGVGERTRGFFEYAFGRLSFLSDISKPVTHDPWVLSQLINQATMFAGIKPHSLHLTFQPAEPIRLVGRNELSYLIALLLLGGDLRPMPGGSLVETRLGDREITSAAGRLYMFEENRHMPEKPTDGITEAPPVAVMEYKFPRLFPARDYQPLIMALKGFQYATNPRPFASMYHRLPGQELYAETAELLRWAERPQPLSRAEIADFVRLVEEGLAREAAAGGHTAAYRAEMLGEIARALTARNEQVRAALPAQWRKRGPG